MTEMSGVQKVIDMAGGVKPLANYLGITTQAIYLWLRDGFVSAPRALELEELYGVPREDLLKPELAALVRAPSKVRSHY